MRQIMYVFFVMVLLSFVACSAFVEGDLSTTKQPLSKKCEAKTSLQLGEFDQFRVSKNKRVLEVTRFRQRSATSTSRSTAPELVKIGKHNYICYCSSSTGGTCAWDDTKTPPRCSGMCSDNSGSCRTKRAPDCDGDKCFETLAE